MLVKRRALKGKPNRPKIPMAAPDVLQMQLAALRRPLVQLTVNEGRSRLHVCGSLCRVLTVQLRDDKTAYWHASVSYEGKLLQSLRPDVRRTLWRAAARMLEGAGQGEAIRTPTAVTASYTKDLNDDELQFMARQLGVTVLEPRDDSGESSDRLAPVGELATAVGPSEAGHLG